MAKENAGEVPLAAVVARNGAGTLHFSLAAHLASARNMIVRSLNRKRRAKNHRVLRLAPLDTEVDAERTRTTQMARIPGDLRDS